MDTNTDHETRCRSSAWILPGGHPIMPHTNMHVCALSVLPFSYGSKQEKIGAESNKEILRIAVIYNIETRIKPIFYTISDTLSRMGIPQTKEKIH
jgi:hypothetical protein